MDINRIGEIISEFWEERKGEICGFLAVLFAGFGGFFAGRIFERENSADTIVEYYCPLGGEAVLERPIGSPSATQSVATGPVVASKKGTKYHYTYCAGAKTISAANLIQFSSALEAENKGYTLAKNCTPKQ